jgi:YD repeat-containing protein
MGTDNMTWGQTNYHDTYEDHRNVLLTKANTRASDSDITISSIGYTVNPISQRTNASRSGAATNSTTWAYDALGQLVTADDSTNDFDRAYEYDGIGNRLTSTSPSGASASFS